MPVRNSGPFQIATAIGMLGLGVAAPIAVPVALIGGGVLDWAAWEAWKRWRAGRPEKPQPSPFSEQMLEAFARQEKEREARHALIAAENERSYAEWHKRRRRRRRRR